MSLFERKLAAALGLVLEAYPPPQPGRALDDLKGRKQPHVNPETNDLWKPTDPNWDEARTTGDAWTIEELILAMMPYVNSLAAKMRSTARGSRIDHEELVQKGLEIFLEKIVGRVTDRDPTLTGRGVGDWYDKGLAPFDQFAYQRIKSGMYDYVVTGKGEGSLKYGREAEIPIQVSTSKEVDGEGGGMTVGDLLAARTQDTQSVLANKELFKRLSDEAKLTEPEKAVIQISYSLFERGEEGADIAATGAPQKARQQKKGKFGRQLALSVPEERGLSEVANFINSNQKLYEFFVATGKNVGALGTTTLARWVPLDVKKLRSQGISADLANLPWIQQQDVNGVPAILAVTKKVTNELRNSAAKKILDTAAVYESKHPQLSEAIRRIAGHFGACLIEYYLKYRPVII